jgi:hypothetical protein
MKPTYEELVAALKRAEEQIKSGYFNKPDAEVGTAWLRKLIATAEA